MKYDEGWSILTRAILHLKQQDMIGHAYSLIDHCRRMILADEYPEDMSILGLLAESTERVRWFTRDLDDFNL